MLMHLRDKDRITSTDMMQNAGSEVDAATSKPDPTERSPPLLELLTCNFHVSPFTRSAHGYRFLTFPIPRGTCPAKYNVNHKVR